MTVKVIGRIGIGIGIPVYPILLHDVRDISVNMVYRPQTTVQHDRINGGKLILYLIYLSNNKSFITQIVQFSTAGYFFSSCGLDKVRQTRQNICLITYIYPIILISYDILLFLYPNIYNIIILYYYY